MRWNEKMNRLIKVYTAQFRIWHVAKWWTLNCLGDDLVQGMSKYSHGDFIWLMADQYTKPCYSSPSNHTLTPTSLSKIHHIPISSQCPWTHRKIVWEFDQDHQGWLPVAELALHEIRGIWSSPWHVHGHLLAHVSPFIPLSSNFLKMIDSNLHLVNIPSNLGF